MWTCKNRNNKTKRQPSARLHQKPKLRVSAVALGAVVLGATAWTGSSEPVIASPLPTGAETAVHTPAAIPITVRMTDFRLELPQRLRPGTYTFNAVNAGRAPHALAIIGPGVPDRRTPVVQAGQSTALTVTLRNGGYDFYCPVGTHKQQGMQLTVTVG
jgi:hypothetical protein